MRFGNLRVISENQARITVGVAVILFVTLLHLNMRGMVHPDVNHGVETASVDHRTVVETVDSKVEATRTSESSFEKKPTKTCQGKSKCPCIHCKQDGNGSFSVLGLPQVQSLTDFVELHNS